ncbi:MAG: PAS domain S-box protein [Bacteroidetes bacterium]|nr:PAS domain S-box protein [Bacteroidota bacterium]
MQYKLLLIEDNSVDTSVFQQMLKHSGVQVSEFRLAESLEEGIKICETSAPDIIFLDLTLPDSSGIDTFHQIKSKIPSVPVVILTGNEDERMALEALRDGAQDYLLKSEISPTLISRSILYALERKRIESELIRSKANNEALIENTKDSIWAVDTKLNFISINTRFSESMELLSGRKPRIGENMLDSLPVSYREWFRGIHERAQKGEQFRVENQLQFTDRKHDIELSVNPIRSTDSEIVGVSFFVRNIDARKLAEQRIRKSEDAYRLLLERIDEGVMFIDNDNQVRFANRKFIETTGFDEQELIGCNFSNLLSEKDPYFGRNIVGELLKDEDPIEVHFKTKSGSIVWFKVKGTPLLDEDGQIGGSLLTHTEITAQKQAEQTIRKQEQEYKNLLETMNEGLIYLEKSGELKFANQRFQDLTGFTIQDIINKRLPSQILPETFFDLIIEDSTTIKSVPEQAYQYEIQITTRKGEHRWCLINCSVIRNEDEIFSGLLVTYSDITDRKSTEEKLQLAERELNTFIYKSSHDLKGPLSSILGLINLLETDEEISKGSPCVQMIRQSAEKLDRMLNEMLNVVRIKREKIYPEIIDFTKEIDEIMHALSSSEGFEFLDKQIKIENQKDLRTDRKLLSAVLQNLFDNAIRYQKQLTDSFLSIYVHDYMHGVKIEVEDNGCGFDEKTRGNIFTMFNKGNTSAKGNGLGLYVVKNAIDRLGGYIELSSGDGKNTKFTIFLPDLYSTEQWQAPNSVFN